MKSGYKFNHKKKSPVLTGLVYMAVLLLVALLFTGCTQSEAGSGGDTMQPEKDPGQVTGAEDTPDSRTEEADRQDIKKLVEELGHNMAEVSLSSPPDILEDQLTKNYQDLISDELIRNWIDNPSLALGRQTSSPWPDRIDIEEMEKINQDSYIVSGQVIEVISVEQEQGGYSGKYTITLTVEFTGGQWLVTRVEKGAYESAGSSKEVESMFNDLDKTTDNINSIFEFIDQNISDADPELATKMVYTVMGLGEEYRSEMLMKFNDNQIQSAIFEQLPSLENIDMDLLKEADNEKLRELIAEAVNKKYRLIAVEGFFEPVIDYQAYKEYSPFVTEEMNDYIEIKAKESENPGVLDAGIPISTDEYVRRIIKAMDYVLKYPDSPRITEVRDYANLRLRFYLGGIDNHPVFDSSQKILPARLNDFEDKLEEYGDTEFGQILDAYLKLLQQEGYAKTQKVNDFLDNIGMHWEP